MHFIVLTDQCTPWHASTHPPQPPFRISKYHTSLPIWQCKKEEAPTFSFTFTLASLATTNATGAKCIKNATTKTDLTYHCKLAIANSVANTLWSTAASCHNAECKRGTEHMHTVIRRGVHFAHIATAATSNLQNSNSNCCSDDDCDSTAWQQSNLFARLILFIANTSRLAGGTLLHNNTHTHAHM